MCIVYIIHIYIFVKGMDLSIRLYTHTCTYIYNTYLCVCAPVYVYVHHCYTTIPRFFNIFHDIHSQMSGLSGFWYIATYPPEVVFSDVFALEVAICRNSESMPEEHPVAAKSLFWQRGMAADPMAIPEPLEFHGIAM